MLESGQILGDIQDLNPMINKISIDNKKRIEPDGVDSDSSTYEGEEENVVGDIFTKVKNADSADSAIKNKFNALMSKEKWMDNGDFKSVYGKVKELAEQDETKMTSFMKNILALHEQGINVVDFIRKQKDKFKRENSDNGRELTARNIAAIMSFDIFKNPIGELKKVKPENTKLVNEIKERFLKGAFEIYRSDASSRVGSDFFFQNPASVFMLFTMYSDGRFAGDGCVGIKSEFITDNDIVRTAESLYKDFEDYISEYIQEKGKNDIRNIGAEDFADFLEYYLSKKKINLSPEQSSQLAAISVSLLGYSTLDINFDDIKLMIRLQDKSYKLSLKDINDFDTKTLKKCLKTSNRSIDDENILSLFDSVPESKPELIEKIAEGFQKESPHLSQSEKYIYRNLNSVVSGIIGKIKSKCLDNVRNAWTNIAKELQDEFGTSNIDEIKDENTKSKFNTELNRLETEVTLSCVCNCLDKCTKSVKTGKKVAKKFEVDVCVFNKLCLNLVCSTKDTCGNALKNIYASNEYRKKLIDSIQKSRSDLIKHFEDQYNQRLNHLKEFLEKASKTEKDLCIATVVTAAVPVITSGLKLIELLGGPKVLELVLGRFTNLGLGISSGLGVVALGLAVATAVKILVDHYKIKQMAIDIEKRPKTEEEKKAGEKLSALRTGNEDIKNAINSKNQNGEIIL